MSDEKAAMSSESTSFTGSSKDISSEKNSNEHQMEAENIQSSENDDVEKSSLDFQLDLNFDPDEDQENQEDEEELDEEPECIGVTFGPQCEEPYLSANKPLVPHLNSDQMLSYNLPKEEFFFDYGSREYLTPYHRLSPSQERYYKIGTDGPLSHIPLYNKLEPESLKQYGLNKNEFFYDEGSTEYLIVYNKLTPEQKVLYGLIESLKLARCDWSDKKDSPYGLTRKQKCILIRQMLKKIREEEKIKDAHFEAENFRKQENKNAYDHWLKKKREAKKQEMIDNKLTDCKDILPANFFRDPVLAYHVWLQNKDEEVKINKIIKLRKTKSVKIAGSGYKDWAKTCLKRLCDDI